MMLSKIAALSITAAAVLAGCSGAKQAASEGAAAAKNAVSPIVGAWKIDGGAPAPKPNLPQFVRLTFTADGKLDASYVAAGGALASVVGTSAKLRRENDTYTIDDDKKLSIIEGSRALDYTYDVRDGKLFLTGKDDSNATVYVKADA